MGASFKNLIMARFCFCGQLVFGTDKNTKEGYCKSHQHLRTDLDKRSIAQKAMSKQRERSKVRGLLGYQEDEGIIDTISELKIDLDRIISRYIRIRDMEADGKITCYICGKRVKWEKAHAMHFIPRGNLSTRFLLDNLKSGDWDCNVGLNGNLKKYAEKLEEERKGTVEFLIEQSQQVSSPTREELKNLLTEFQFKLRVVENAKLK